jgi:hypothetical protein
MELFGVVASRNCSHSLHGVLHSDTFPTVNTMHQSEFIWKIYASRKLTYRVDHPGMRG